MKGVFTALVTPFKSSGLIDWDCYLKILDDQIDAKIAGVVVSGTTGESPTLKIDEKTALIEKTLQHTRGSGLKVIAGTGSYSTAESITQTHTAEKQGVDAVLVVTPYYNKPSQAGLTAHFKSIADSISTTSKCELILYNVPGRTGVSLSVKTVSELAKHPKITSIKEASGNLAFAAELVDSLNSSRQTLTILSGDDATFLPLLSLGASGIISVASNLFPRAMVRLFDAAQTGDFLAARKIHERYFPLFRDLFIESNPTPIKWAMQYAGFCSAMVRSPLASLSSESSQTLEQSLKACGIQANLPA